MVWLVNWTLEESWMELRRSDFVRREFSKFEECVNSLGGRDIGVLR